MATLSFYARGDGSTANNAALNVESQAKQPTTQITFESGDTGDIILESNGGLPDPDTTVTIDGTSYEFIVEQTGDLPIGNKKVPDVLEGNQITVISVVIDGSYERFFFVTDGSGSQALMAQFGNGAIALENVDTDPTSVFICFCGGTDILTPLGYRKVDTLAAGDLVLNDAGEAVPILWIGHSGASVEEMRNDPARRPIRIPAQSIANGVPHADLYVSAQHRIVFEGFRTDLYFGEPNVMVLAKDLVGAIAEQVTPDRDVTYFHVLLDRHEMLVSNGLATESFQPSLRSYNGISPGMRRSLSYELSGQRIRALFNRPDAMPTLKAREARALIGAMFDENAHAETGRKPHLMAA